MSNPWHVTFHTMMTTEVKADVYGGDSCDEVSSHFVTYCDGDKESEDHLDDIIIPLYELPPGAKITVEYPCCPSCDLPRQDILTDVGGGRKFISGHESKCECGFDWDKWVLEQYS